MKCLLVLPFAGAAVAFAGFGAKSPMPEVQVTKVANFSWADPFASHRMRPGGKLEAACGAERTFAAREYLLHDLYEHEPRGLWPYGDALKRSFAGRPYPGGWGGLDPHLYDRPLLSMSYGDVPLAVRAWIEANGRDPQSPDRHLFAVFERPVAEGEKVVQTVVPAKTPEKAAQFRPLDARRIVIFAPGALYKILPLWVAEGECRDTFMNLSRYTSKPKDGAVVAWTTHHSTPNRQKDERDIKFTIKAQALKAMAGSQEHVKAEKDEL